MSVLLVTHNQEAFVGQALASVLMQDVDFSVEILVADDCSGDSTLARVGDYLPHDDLRVLPADRHLGITQNYRRGFAACRGEYVAVLDGDDFWLSPSKLSTAVAYLDRHTECSMCFHRVLLLHEPTRQVTVVRLAAPGHRRCTAGDLRRRNFIAGFSACVYRRDAIERLDPALYEMTMYDWLFNIAIAQLGYIGYIDEVMSVYRQHPGGAWSGLAPHEQAEEWLRSLDSYKAFLGIASDP